MSQGNRMGGREHKWTIRVCRECGERVPDDRTIHGCGRPGLYSYPVEVEVVPASGSEALGPEEKAA